MAARRTPSPNLKQFVGDMGRKSPLNIATARRGPSPKQTRAPTGTGVAVQRPQMKHPTPTMPMPTSYMALGDCVEVPINQKNQNFLSQSAEGSTWESHKSGRHLVPLNDVRKDQHLRNLVDSQKVNSSKGDGQASEFSDLTQATETEPYMSGSDTRKSRAVREKAHKDEIMEIYKALGDILHRGHVPDMMKATESLKTHVMKLAGGEDGLGETPDSVTGRQRRSKSSSDAMLRSHLKTLRLHVDYDDPELTNLPKRTEAEYGRDGAMLEPTKMLFNSHVTAALGMEHVSPEDGDGDIGRVSPPGLQQFMPTTVHDVPPLKLGSMSMNSCWEMDDFAQEMHMDMEPGMGSMVRRPSDNSTTSNGSKGLVLSPRTAFDDISVSSQNSADTGSVVSSRMY